MKDNRPRPKKIGKSTPGLRVNANLSDVEAALMANSLAKIGYWRLYFPSFKGEWSEGMNEMFGFDAGQAKDRHAVMAGYHPDDRHLVEQAFNDIQVTEEPISLEYRIRRPDGEIRHVWTRLVREQASRDGEVQVFGFNIDLTEMRNQDDDLIASERQLRFMINYSRDVICRFDGDGRLTYVSPAASTVMGYEAKELIGRRPWHFTHADDWPRLAAIMNEMIDDGRQAKVPSIEYRFLHKTKGWVWLSGNPRLIVDFQGKVVEWIDVIRDITDRKRAEEETASARAAAEAAVAAKAEFLATLSHELRTPLTGIIGLSQLVGANGQLNAQDQKYLDMVQVASRQLIGIINNVMDVSRLEAGAVEIDQEAFRLADTVQTVLTLIEPEARAKGLTLTSHLPKSMPVLIGDSGRITQILYNLLGNSIKYTAMGEIKVAVELVLSSGQANITLRIRDTGKGLDPSQIPFLFERFARGEQETNSQLPGAGLGLSISRQLVELMGGTIGAKNLSTGGSEFWFSLDLPILEAPPEVSPPRDQARSGAETLKVLLAEDNAFSQELIRTCLKPLDCELDTVVNGQEAILATQRKAYDLILMDIRMPGMDGQAATRAIRAMGEPWIRVPIIALSGNTLPSEIDACLAAGMNDHVGKPILPSALFAAIGRHTKIRS